MTFPPNLNALRDIYSHDLVKLIGAAKLQTALDADAEEYFFQQQLGCGQRLEHQQQVRGKWIQRKRFISGVAGQNGVMQWLRQRW
jgi:hypothetical protein